MFGKQEQPRDEPSAEAPMPSSLINRSAGIFAAPVNALGGAGR